VSGHQQRPWGLSITALVMLTFLVCESVALVLSFKVYGSVFWSVFFVVLVELACFFGILSYWQGQNTGRRAVLGYSVYVIVRMLYWDYTYFTVWTRPRLSFWRVTNTLELLLAAYLLYWLNTPRMQAFFEGPEGVPERQGFLGRLRSVGIWVAAALIFLLGICLAGGAVFARSGLSNLPLLAVSMLGSVALPLAVVSIYYALRKERKTRRRYAFFTATWTLALGFLLLAWPSPLRTLSRYSGGKLVAERNLWYAENDDGKPSRTPEERHRLIEERYSNAEAWHRWGIEMAENLGPASPVLAGILEDSGDFYASEKQYDKAAELYRRSRATWERALGAENSFAEQVHKKLVDTVRAADVSPVTEPQ
jgi:hypothetical protein